MKVGTVRIARHPSRCRRCRMPIRPGNHIISTLRGWVHWQGDTFCPTKNQEPKGVSDPKALTTT